MHLGTLFPLISTVVDKIFPDKSEAAKHKTRMMEMAQNGELRELEAKAKVVEAEAKSESYLTSNWRPITMLVFVAIIANNYLLYPYLSLFWQEAPQLDLPPHMWDLLKIGLGGYVVSRGFEKGVQSWKNPSK